MKPFQMMSFDITELELSESGDWEYPFNIWVNDGFGKSEIAFTKAEAEAMRDWLNEALSPLENK